MSLYITATTVDGTEHILQPREAIPVRINLRAVDNTAIGDQFGDYSQSFEIAGNEIHDRFFNYAFDVAGQLVPASDRTIPVTLSNENQDLFKGNMTLEDVSTDANGLTIYSVNFDSTFTGLTKALGDLLMSGEDSDIADLWGTEVELYSMDNVIRSHSDLFTGLWPDHYYYPLTDTGFDNTDAPRVLSDQTGTELTNAFGEISMETVHGSFRNQATPLRVQQFAPAISVKRVLEKIFELAGKTFDSTYVDEALRDLYILPSPNKGNGIVLFDGAQDYGFRSSVHTSGNIRVEPFSDGGVFSNTDNFNNVVQWTFNEPELLVDGGLTGYANGIVTIPVRGSYEHSFRGRFIVVAEDLIGLEWIDISARITYSGDTPDEIVALDRLGSTGTEDGDYSWDIKSTRNLSAGQTVSCQLVLTKARQRAFSAPDVDIVVIGAAFSTEQTPLIWDGQELNLGLQFGQDKAIDYLNSIMQHLNGIIEGDSVRRDHYRIIQYLDWIGSGEQQDWTDRIDASSIAIVNHLVEQPKNIEFTSAEDDDRFSVQALELEGNRSIYGSLSLEPSTSDILDGDRTIGDFFGPTMTAPIAETLEVNGKVVLTAPNSGIPHLYEYGDDGEAESFKFKPRLGYVNRFTPPSFYHTDGLTATLFGQGDEGFASMFTLSNVNRDGDKDINFSTDYFLSDNEVTETAYDNWKQQIDHLYDRTAVKLRAKAMFSPDEYPVALNTIVHYKGNTYLLNAIDGFNMLEDGLANIELISYRGNFTSVAPVVTPPIIDGSPGVSEFVISITGNITGIAGTPEILTANSNQEDVVWYWSTGVQTETTSVETTGTYLLTGVSTDGRIVRTEHEVIFADPAPEVGTVSLSVSNSVRNSAISITTTINGLSRGSLATVEGVQDGDVVVIRASVIPNTGFALGGAVPVISFVNGVLARTSVHEFTHTWSNGDGDVSQSVSFTGVLRAVVADTIPIVITNTPSLVTTTTATLNGTVTSNGGATVTEITFIWAEGTHTTLAALLAASTSESMGTAVAAGAYIRSLTDLTEATSYSFVLSAENAVGVGYGGIQTFSTPSALDPRLVLNPTSIARIEEAGGVANGRRLEVTPVDVTGTGFVFGSIQYTHGIGGWVQILRRYGPGVALPDGGPVSTGFTWWIQARPYPSFATTADREALLTFRTISGTRVSTTIGVSQGGDVALDVTSTDSGEINAEGATRRLNVDTDYNSAWSITNAALIPEWLTLSETRGNGDTGLRATVAAWADAPSATTTRTFTLLFGIDDDGTLTDSVTITQVGRIPGNVGTFYVVGTRRAYTNLGFTKVVNSTHSTDGSPGFSNIFVGFSRFEVILTGVGNSWTAFLSTSAYENTGTVDWITLGQTSGTSGAFVDFTVAPGGDRDAYIIVTDADGSRAFLRVNQTGLG